MIGLNRPSKLGDRTSWVAVCSVAPDDMFTLVPMRIPPRASSEQRPMITCGPIDSERGAQISAPSMIIDDARSSKWTPASAYNRILRSTNGSRLTM